jgi:hypothetical protein
MLIQEGVNSGWWLWRQMAVLAPSDIPSLREKLPKARPERRRRLPTGRQDAAEPRGQTGADAVRVPLAVFCKNSAAGEGKGVTALTRRAGARLWAGKSRWPWRQPGPALQRGVSGIPHIFRSSVSRRARRWLAEKRACRVARRGA